MLTTEEAKTRLDLIIGKSRVDLYKPIHIAEVLHRSRTVGDFDIAKPATFQNPSLRWRNEVTNKLAGKVSTSSARYQHDVWNTTAMPTEILAVLDAENKATGGAVEKYIYSRYGERQGTVSSVISAIKEADFKIANRVESDSLAIVCKDAEAKVIETVLKQIGYGASVRGIVKESGLVNWYEKCLRGKFSGKLAKPLLERLSSGFEAEFPFSTTLAEFLEKRGYNNLEIPEFWKV